MSKEINPQFGALLDAADVLIGVAGKIHHDAFFRARSPRPETLEQLQDVQHIIDQHSADAPCVRRIQDWHDYLVGASVGLMREKYSNTACAAFQNESLRLQREFDEAIQRDSN